MTVFALLAACLLPKISDSRDDYEWFHTTHNIILSKVAQIQGHASLVLSSDDDPIEKGRLQVELSGMMQSCRDLVSEYNSRSDQVTRSVFMGTSLPDHISIDVCEVK